jgi:rubredoxin
LKRRILTSGGLKFSAGFRFSRLPGRPEKKGKGEEEMKKYTCNICGYVYDPAVGDSEGGIKPGTPFEQLPKDWVCPVCGASKDDFTPES